MSITRYSHAEAAEREQIAQDYAVPIQQAGLPLTLLEVAGEASETPLELRRRLVSQLQRTLPTTVSRSVRANLSPQAPADVVASTEAEVLSAVADAAHQSPVLRTVVTRDRSGREVTEFVGQKRSWMAQFEAQPQIMTRLGAVSY